MAKIGKTLFVLLSVFAALFASTNLIAAQSLTKTIHLAKGKKIILKGSIREGDEFRYLFHAREGQIIAIKLITHDAVFSLYGGGGGDDLICEEKTSWSGKLPEGDADNEYGIAMKSNYKLASYTIEVLLR